MFKRTEYSEPNEKDPWTDDVLGRRRVAEFLTPLLATSTGPFVLNVDSPWGTGKTFFLKRWCQAVKKTHPVVYFNAWETDFIEEPFVSFLAEAHHQLSSQAVRQEAKDKVAGLAKKGARVIRGFVPVVVKAVGRKLLGEGGLEEAKDVLDTATEEEVIDAVVDWGARWLDEFAAEKSAIAEFRQYLESTVKTLSSADLKPPIFVFVDELDRCRPTFSIRLLERIKHIFGVPGVVFVLGTDTKQLGHSIGAVYGEGFDTTEYLRRFIDQTYTLPLPDYEQFAELLFDQESRTLWSDPQRPLMYPKGFAVDGMFAAVARRFQLTLRQQEQCFGRLTAIRRTWDRTICFPLLAGLVAMRTAMEDDYKAWRNNRSKLGALATQAKAKFRSPHEVESADSETQKEFWNYFDVVFNWADNPSVGDQVKNYQMRDSLKEDEAQKYELLKDVNSERNDLKRHADLVELAADLS